MIILLVNQYHWSNDAIGRYKRNDLIGRYWTNSEYFFNTWTSSYGGADTFSDQSNTLIGPESSDLIGGGNDHCVYRASSFWLDTKRRSRVTAYLFLYCNRSHYLYIFVWVSYVHSIKVSVSNFRPNISIRDGTFFKWTYDIYTWTYCTDHLHVFIRASTSKFE